MEDKLLNNLRRNSCCNTLQVLTPNIESKESMIPVQDDRTISK